MDFAGFLLFELVCLIGELHLHEMVLKIGCLEEFIYHNVRVNDGVEEVCIYLDYWTTFLLEIFNTESQWAPTMIGLIKIRMPIKSCLRKGKSYTNRMDVSTEVVPAADLIHK
ncbi:hypothetical protein GCM10011282_10890 [Undibacterium macrobrachii]|uniref:Uncharacterized protein n=1 Tax=Undibacterium macrobrachii TaxID=1119058 RepID=A0ABQ2X9K5_9BURK|nr:hypothetical protein GCM10011282_10890 [Undibacterium macrobrachii]